MKTKFLLLFIFFSLFKSFGQINFEHHKIFDNSNHISRSNIVISADMDGDSDLDLIVGTISSIGKIFLLENLDGTGNFSSPRVIGYFVNNARSIVAVDIDGDGDLDLLTASHNTSWDSRLSWYENMDGLGNFENQQIIDDNLQSVRSADVADVDGDGDMDVLASYTGQNDRIVWYENTNSSGTFGSPQIIATDIISNNILSVDVDGDGDMDLMGSHYDFITGGDLIWYENMDGLGDFSTEKLIAPFNVGGSEIFSTDIDNDGDKDLIVASFVEEKIVWFENMNGLGDFGSENIITTGATSVRSIYCIDLDGDGDTDIVSASLNNSNNNISWYENLDGLGDFGNQEIISTDVDQATFIYAGDLDGDNDIDIFSASFLDHKIAWYENIDGLGNFGSQQLLTRYCGSCLLYPIDFDMDGDIDFITPSGQGGKMAWFENINGLGQFSNQIILTDSADFVRYILLVDIDGDNDKDIVGFSHSVDRIIWYENLGGSLGSPKVMLTEVEDLNTIRAMDMDNDGDLDLISASWDQKLAWYENMDGLGDFGNQQIISNETGNRLQVGDLNGDGDLDLISVNLNDSILWYENLGQNNFGLPQFISSDVIAVTSLSMGDLDGDGDLDILSSSLFDGKIAWYENIDGQGNFSSQKIITTTTGIEQMSFVEIGDIDSDGDLDVFSTSYNNNSGSIVWYENVDGDFENHYTIYSSRGFRVGIVDIDNDNDLDLFSSALNGSMFWHENIDFTDIHENNLIDFIVYPVPTSDKIVIQSNKPIVRIEIYDKLGRMVLSKDNSSQVDISFLNTGFYFCKVQTGKSEWGVKKIIKQ